MYYMFSRKAWPDVKIETVPSAGIAYVHRVLVRNTLRHINSSYTVPKQVSRVTGELQSLDYR